MLSVRSSVVIGRPVERVFEFVADFENEPLWKPQAVRHVERLAGQPIQVGARYREVTIAGDQESETTFDLVGLEPNKRVAYETSGGSAGTYTFESVASGTRVTFGVRLGPRTLARLLFKPAALATLRRRIEAELAGLRDVLESEGRS